VVAAHGWIALPADQIRLADHAYQLVTDIHDRDTADMVLEMADPTPTVSATMGPCQGCVGRRGQREPTLQSQRS
jgi:hypothetical protein